MPVPYDFFDYQKYWKGRDYEDGAERIALSRFLNSVGKKELLVDIGAGFGRLTELYLPFAQKVFLCEPSKKLSGIAKKKFADIPKITFCKTSLPNLTLKKSSFDVSLMVRVIHHFQDSKKVIKELFRVLKPGGFLVLEFANKIHFKALMKAILKGNFSFLSDVKPYEQRTKESIAKRKIYFFNHHPKKILKDLKDCGFEVKEILSVSNFRDPIIKKIIPLRVLLFLEKITQKPLSFIYFGPSIFILAYKSHNT